MPIQDYKDFILVVDPVADAKGTAGQYSVHVFDSPAGQGEYKEKRVLPEDIDDALGLLERRKYDDDLPEQMKIGRSLGDFLFPPYARRILGECLNRLKDDEGLRIRLRLPDELVDIPWEFLYLKDDRDTDHVGNFLLLDSKISLVRHEAISIPGDWFEAPTSRRMVVAMASPEDYSSLDYLKKEQEELKSVLNDVKGLDVTYVPNDIDDPGESAGGATLKGLVQALFSKTDIFHFSGHGEFVPTGNKMGKKTGKGAIILCDEENRASIISAEDFAALMRGKGIRLVVLSSCETGRRDGRNVWSSVVGSILKAGIPAVVAMQYSISDRLAAAFSGMFYRALIAGFYIDEAVALGRAAIRSEAAGIGKKEIRDWGVPVLYLRSADGRVFMPIQNDDAVKESNEKAEAVITQDVVDVGSSGWLIGAINEGSHEGMVKVDQRIEEENQGFVVGAYVFDVRNGRLRVKQKAKKVTGVMVGVHVGSKGDDESAMERLEKLMVLKQQTIYCSKCGNELSVDDKFCRECGNSSTSK